ncbi:putative mitochondrial protein AtMg00710 [Primulina tabacum]|uniref:putative mitochondrial protein AtMg00710 n=1 Tax=Primulina tabacum TaxID=48773 RepID=UPI003F5A2173
MRHFKAPYTPQQNGLAERMNSTILESVRCLLSHSGVYKAFWAEAANTACHLINRSPSVSLGLKTPMERWTSTSPHLDELKVFGCAAYAHVKKGKLDDRARKCIFL